MDVRPEQELPVHVTPPPQKKKTKKTQKTSTYCTQVKTEVECLRNSL